MPPGLVPGGPTEAVPLKPKVITIFRTGAHPRTSVKILLNRRSVMSFEQLMSDISEAFGPKWKSNKVRKLFTTRGREVKGVSDFFREDDYFIAVGNEELTEMDVAEIIEEMYPDSSYAKVLLKDWDKQRRKHKATVALLVKESKEGDGGKLDSGFVDISDSGSHREQEYDPLHSNRSQRLHRSKRLVTIAADKESIAESEASSPQSFQTPKKPEKDRNKKVHDERDKARRKQQRLLELERKAQDEERKRRGLVSLNPLKPLEDIPKREPPEKERPGEAHTNESNEEKKMDEENDAERNKREMEKEERIKAERNARERMAAAERAEREKQEQERKEKEKTDKVETDFKAQTEDREKDEKAASEKMDHTEKEAATEEKDKEKDRKRRRDKDPGNDKNSLSRKTKTKVVRRSKAERQVSSDSFVLERYDLGRTLGDGNFAVVRISKNRSSGQEFAMKVIDKPKLKGKEHMVENEIDIMKDCNHPNIVKLYEEFETADKIYLVMELVKVSVSFVPFVVGHEAGYTIFGQCVVLLL